MKQPVKQTQINIQQEQHETTTLKELFLQFTHGASDMDGKVFAKLCKDCKVLSKEVTATDVDLVFAQIKDKAARKITYPQFNKGIDICANKRKQTSVALIESMLAQGGPVFKGTKAEAVKYHDDKSLYTGVHANGGPSTVGGTGGISDISQLCDRSTADVRGTKV